MNPLVRRAKKIACGPSQKSDSASQRNTYILMLCQALYASSLAIDLTLAGLVGYTLASNKALATLPFALITVAAALTTIFASMLLGRIGKKWGFMVGACAATVGGGISVWAIFHQSFPAFCVGTSLVGVFQAFAQYYRLAAADAVTQAAKAKAISIVLTGGVIAAIAGPMIAGWSKDLFSPVMFAGSYFIVTLFGLTSITLLGFFYRNNTPHKNFAYKKKITTTRSLKQIVRQPIYIAALANNALGYAVMMFIMTATPIAAIACGHTIIDGAHIIQWHMVGMFAPSLFAARLIQKFGVLHIVYMGITLSTISGALALYSTDLHYFYAALGCLGIGWNFMFVGGSTLLAQSYRPEESSKAQAFSEFSTFMFSALGSLFAGQLLDHFGWKVINLATFPLLFLALICTLVYSFSKKHVFHSDGVHSS